MALDRNAVRRVIDLLKQSRAAELEIGDGQGSVRVARSTGLPAPAAPVAAAEAPAEPAAPGELTAGRTAPEPEEVSVSYIVGKMVGLFHRGSRPDGEPLVQVGDRVSKGQVVATIEALRKLTEVTSPVAGEIAEVLVEDGEPVEYGQKLFAVKGPEEPDA